MNILFIEDEKELLKTAMAQLEIRGYTVYPATDIAEARAVLQVESNLVDMVITDHRLPDGLGIQFAIEIKDTYPQVKSAIVSGCLTADDIKEIEAHGLLYFHKPLLYGKVVESVRQHYSMIAHVAEVEKDEPVKEAPNKFFGLFGGKSNGEEAE
ncbi:MAG: response regulator [Opitutaceae bacterium]